MKRRLGATFMLVEDMLATSITLPIEMMNAAHSAAKGRDRRGARLNIASAAKTRDPVPTRSGFVLTPDLAIEEIGSTDMVIIPSLWRNPRPIMRRNPEIIEWLRHLNQQGSILIAVGTGCCFLAEAGLLNGKAATTHWHYFDQFQRDYPDVELKRQYFITQSGNIYCAASVNAVADLTVHFIHRTYGQEIASHVQRNFSHEIRRPYESTSYYDDKHRYHPDEDIVQAQIWLQDNCQKEVLLKSVAEKFDMSVRTFNRRFKNATGKTPLQYLQEIRIDMAKDLLQTSNLSVSEIAYKVGYQDMGHFSSLFKKLLSTTPSDYRATVRAKLFSAET
ncbi:helix-turn-helix domain-containing protein [Pseudomaricurvus alkylphenolicus]|jgi:transcriptional regulator GlxA family with amidase domain|uniref:GlxA family transcriptional regulator n=1 Tax=Pseudomaricurvus alkylphenolicus TaxID=1306991 RepID=UPI00141DD2BB|nr:helix-turn-helix domain-containing protein [Pseudomaricurvus alkylphenolicus]NIB43856.1 helix-turn-helix domain-containing protein [Pseudomaricurvus alkylphenolicus]